MDKVSEKLPRQQAGVNKLFLRISFLEISKSEERLVNWNSNLWMISSKLIFFKVSLFVGTTPKLNIYFHFLQIF